MAGNPIVKNHEEPALYAQTKIDGAVKNHRHKAIEEQTWDAKGTGTHGGGGLIILPGKIDLYRGWGGLMIRRPSACGM